jgi:ATP/maltotriose-dependent transcriptional regulator MalT
LIERLDRGLHRKLTLISAPAGFGKTTLVIEWLDNLRGGAQKGNQFENWIAWLSLDDGELRSAASRLGEQIRPEEGIGKAVRLVEETFAT